MSITDDLSDVSVPPTRTEAEVVADAIVALYEARLLPTDPEAITRVLAVTRISVEELSRARTRYLGRRVAGPRSDTGLRSVPMPDPPMPFNPPAWRSEHSDLAMARAARPASELRRCARCPWILVPEDNGYSMCRPCRDADRARQARFRQEKQAELERLRSLAKPVLDTLTVRLRADKEGFELVCKVCRKAVKDGDEIRCDGLRHAVCPAKEA